MFAFPADECAFRVLRTTQTLLQAGVGRVVKKITKKEGSGTYQCPKVRTLERTTTRRNVLVRYVPTPTGAYVGMFTGTSSGTYQRLPVRSGYVQWCVPAFTVRLLVGTVATGTFTGTSTGTNRECRYALLDVP